MLKKVILISYFMMLAAGGIAQQKFPAWMDEAGASDSKTVTQGFNEPAAPVDPSTGQPSGIGRPPGSVMGKPVLPDFSKMREKAIKAELERRVGSEGELESSYSASISNLDQLKNDKSRLESLLAAAPGANERQQLLAGLGELSKKLALSEEFVRLLGQNGQAGSSTQQVASMSAAQFNRAIELQRLLFPGKRANRATGVAKPVVQGNLAMPATNIATTTVDQNAATATESAEAADKGEEERRVETYRPGKIKSFYLESKKAQKKQQEADGK